MPVADGTRQRGGNPRHLPARIDDHEIIARPVHLSKGQAGSGAILNHALRYNLDTPPPPELRFLKLLVTTLTAVLIVGLVAILSLLTIRLAAPPPTLSLDLPEQISLPEDAEAQAVTLSADWIIILTTDDEVLLFERSSGALSATTSLR